MSQRLLACWGNAGHGRLGLDGAASIPTVCSRLAEESCSFVACGGAHTCVVTGQLPDVLQLYLPPVTGFGVHVISL